VNSCQTACQDLHYHQEILHQSQSVVMQNQGKCKCLLTLNWKLLRWWQTYQFNTNHSCSNKNHFFWDSIEGECTSRRNYHFFINLWKSPNDNKESKMSQNGRVLQPPVSNPCQFHLWIDKVLSFLRERWLVVA